MRAADMAARKNRLGTYVGGDHGHLRGDGPRDQEKGGTSYRGRAFQRYLGA